MTTPGPLPPNERWWRHPSELAAPAHEPPTRGSRVLVASTATAGLAVVGLLAVLMTPGRSAPGDAVVSMTATSTASALSTLAAEPVGAAASVANDVSRQFTGLIGRTLGSLLPATTAVAAPAATELGAPLAVVVVTPLDDGELGVTTAAALDGRTGPLQALLPSGDIVTGELVDATGDVAVIRLVGAAGGGAAVAEGAPHRDAELTVVAYGDEIAVAGGGLADLAVPEGAPIFDAGGALVGLCTIGPAGVEMLPMTSLPATSSGDGAAGTGDDVGDPADPTTAPASSEPPTTGGGATSTEPAGSTAPSTGVPATSTVDDSVPGTTADTVPASVDASGDVATSEPTGP